jgi:class 3 adenylate cyclase
VGRGGVEPPTFRFSAGRSYQLSYLPMENLASLPEVRRASGGGFSRWTAEAGEPAPYTRSVPTCPNCGRELPGEFAFCPFCGAAAERPVSRGEQQRRTVTVVFCDLVGSTAAADGADVEDVQRRLSSYHQIVRERIEAFGGVVEKFVGDAVMAVFGAPTAHEDDAERAVRAGLSILEVVDDLDGIHVRVGINTGEALVALDARPEAGESFVIGDMVNTAARLQSAAPIDAAVVGEATYRATDRVFEYAELEPFTAKGKTEPVALWQALAAKSRFGTDLMRNLDVPMVGRSVELATLVNAFERADAGQLQLVTVVGEAGVGKSRLVAELFAHIDRQPTLVTWRQGRCLPYGDGIAYWALAEIVKAHLGIYDGDTDEDVRAKLGQLEDAGLPVWVIASLTALLGLPGAETGDRNATFDAWRQFFELMTEEQPAVVVVEDLHWADPLLLDFLEHLADWPGTSRLLLLGTARPELLSHRPTWTAGLANAATVRLTSLSAADTEQLLSALGSAQLPDDLRAEVIERSGGNPLYAEELVRMLRDRAAARPGRETDASAGLTTLPETVQALIAARIDTLAPTERDILHTAAVVGKVFWTGAVAALLDQTAAEVDPVLRTLARRDMVRPMRRSTVPGDQEWAFTHVLIRDVAYQQQLREVRAARHLAAAEWLIDTNGERVRDVSEILVHHTALAVELADAIADRSLSAGARPLLRRSLYWASRHLLGLDQSRAIGYAERAVAMLDDHVPPAEVADILEIWVTEAIQDHPMHEVLDVADRVILARHEAHDLLQLARSLVLALTWTRTSGDQTRVPRYEAELSDLLPQLPRSAERTLALAEFAIRAMFNGDSAGSLTLGREAAQEAESAGEPTDEGAADAWISAHNAMGLAMLRAGDPDGIGAIRAAIRVAERWYPHRALYMANNVATGVAATEGLPAGVAEAERTIVACHQRGLLHSAYWVESSALVFRLTAGELQHVFDRAPELARTLTEIGSLVSSESVAALASAAAELGRSGEVDELVSSITSVTTLAGMDADARMISATGALDHLLATGQTGLAQQMLAEAMREPDAYEMFPRTGRLARVAHALDDAAALRLLKSVVPESFAMGRAGVLVVDALLADLAGEAARAVTSFMAAADACEALGADLEVAYARLYAAETTLRSADLTPAVRAVAAQALEAFEAMGAVPAAERARRVLAA